jgi:DNA-binding CsgD family transcriptional regulator
MLLRLIAESSELRRADRSARMHFLAGLARIARSAIAIRMTASGVGRDSPLLVTQVDDLGWATPSDRERVYSYVTNKPVGSDPLAAALLDPERVQVTLARSDVMSTADWALSEMRNDVHRPAGIDESLFSFRRRDCGKLVDVLVLKREWGAPPFGDDERELVDVVQSECAWLFEDEHASTCNVAVNDHLTRRERETLRLLLSGDSEKGIAATLGLSPHTVHQYVRNIYRKAGVASRAELMASALAPHGTRRLATGS